MTRWSLGKGTAAALRFVCPHCSAALGARCVEPGGKPRRYVHSQRMKLAARTAGVQAGSPAADQQGNEGAERG